jgi:hypothetical protein
VIINPARMEGTTMTVLALDTVDATAIEPKVAAATAAASSAAVVVTFLLWLLGAYVFGGEVPLPVQGIVGLIVTSAATFLAGYYARHVDRVPAGS